MEPAVTVLSFRSIKARGTVHLLQVATLAWVKGTNVTNASWSDVSIHPSHDRTALLSTCTATTFRPGQAPVEGWSEHIGCLCWLQDHLNYINEATLVPILPGVLPPPYEGAGVHAVRHSACCVRRHTGSLCHQTADHHLQF